MGTTIRSIASISALFATTLLVAGCASTPSTAPTSSQEPADTPTAQPTEDLDVAAAWLDEGRMLAVVTWGSSSCVPVAEVADSEGQRLDVTLDPGDPDQPCTADFAARASLLELPSGIDPTQDVELAVTLGESTGDTALTGQSELSGVPGEPTDFAASAGWFDDSALVLLTWGSSSCQPIVDSVSASGSTGTISFVTEDGPCTEDLGPRTTLVQFADIDADAQDAFTLELVGGGLDGTVSVVNN